MNLSGMDKGISTYKTYISESPFQWPEDRSVFYMACKAVGKCSNALYSEVNEREHAILSQDVLVLCHYWRPICRFDPMISLGNSRSYEVKFSSHHLITYSLSHRPISSYHYLPIAESLNALYPPPVRFRFDVWQKPGQQCCDSRARSAVFRSKGHVICASRPPDRC